MHVEPWPSDLRSPNSLRLDELMMVDSISKHCYQWLSIFAGDPSRPFALALIAQT
jgi:hypothetical protein